MPTNLALDDNLINGGPSHRQPRHQKGSRHRRTRRVHPPPQAARDPRPLRTIDYDPTYDYKKVRKLDRIELDEE